MDLKNWAFTLGEILYQISITGSEHLRLISLWSLSSVLLRILLLKSEVIILRGRTEWYFSPKICCWAFKCLPMAVQTPRLLEQPPHFSLVPLVKSLPKTNFYLLIFQSLCSFIFHWGCFCCYLLFSCVACSTLYCFKFTLLFCCRVKCREYRL